jgi:hypothetical protein
VGDAGVDGVMQAEADDTVIVRVERPGGGSSPSTGRRWTAVLAASKPVSSEGDSGAGRA